MKNTILTLALIPTLTFASITSNLKFGMANTQVIELQSFLISKGYLQASLKTGYFGNKTLTAVKKYQDDKELPSTGFVGALTRASIANDTAIQTPTSTLPTTASVEIIEPIQSQISEPIVAPIVVTEYNKAMEQTPLFTIGTPERITKTIEERTFSYVLLPVTFDNSVKSFGNTLSITGEAVHASGTKPVRSMAALTSDINYDYKFDLTDIRGTLTYTAILTNSKGTVLYTDTNSVEIN